MSWSVSSGAGDRTRAIERFTGAVAQIGRDADRAQAEQCIAMAGALDLEQYDEPIELIADGHVHTRDSVPSWVRLQVSTREALIVDEVEGAPAEAGQVTVVEGGDAANAGEVPTSGGSAPAEHADASTETASTDAGTPSTEAIGARGRGKPS